MTQFLSFTPIEAAPDSCTPFYAQVVINDNIYILKPRTYGYGNASFWTSSYEDTGEDVFVYPLNNRFISIRIKESCILDINDIKVSLGVKEYYQIDNNYPKAKPGLDVFGETFSVPKSADIFIKSSTTLSGNNVVDKVASKGAEIFNCGFLAGTPRINKATGSYSHAEGLGTYAVEDYSHTEGLETITMGEGSHTEGLGTVTGSSYQHVEGQLNIVDTKNKYVHIVGNGEVGGERSNAHTLDWGGNAWYAGTVEGTALILNSSTEGSSKRFQITVDDSGTISATEITT